MAQAPSDSLPPSPLHARLLHHPKEVLLDGYPYDIDLIVNLPRDSVDFATLFLRVNEDSGFREIPMKFERNRFRYRFNPRELPADSLEYYFVVTLIDGSMLAAPLDENHQLQPVRRELIDPQIYYRTRRIFK